MTYPIDQRKVAGVVAEAQKALDGHNFSHGEVLVGLAELLGRVIVSAAKTPIQGQDAAAVVLDHIGRTLQAGFGAKGFNTTQENSSGIIT